MGWACPQSHCRLLISAALDQAPCVVSIFAGINQMLQALSYYIVGGIAEEALYITIQLQDDVLVSSHISHISHVLFVTVHSRSKVHFLLRHTAVQTPSGAALSLVGVQVLSYSQRISSEFIHFQSQTFVNCQWLWSIHVHSRQIMKPLLGPMVTWAASWGLCYCFGWIWQKARSPVADGSGMSWTDRPWWYRTPTLERRLCSVGFPSSLTVAKSFSRATYIRTIRTIQANSNPITFQDWVCKRSNPLWRLCRAELTAMIFNMLDYQGLFTNLDSLCSKDCFHGPSTLVHWKLGWTWFCKACTTSLVCTFLLQCFPLFGKWERLAVHDVTLFNFHLMATSWRHIELCEGSSYLFPCASCLTRHSHSLRAHSVCIHLRVVRALQWIQHGHVPCAHGLIVHIRSARWSFLHCQPSCFTACGDLPDLQYAAVYSNVWWGVIGSKYPHVSTASVPWQMWMLLIAAYLVPDTVDEDGEAKLWNSLKQISELFQIVANIWRFHIFPTVLVSKCQGLPKTLRTVLYLDVLHLDQQAPGFASICDESAAFWEWDQKRCGTWLLVTASEMWVMYSDVTSES